jgi:rhamnogalacturonyl hydrolase YesR
MAIAAQAIIDGARLYPQELGPLVKPVVEALYRYKSPQLKGYCAVENFSGNSDIYYDDDAQVASVLITAYEVTGEKSFLDSGRELVRYLMGGWNNDKQAKNPGGVLWHRDKPYISAISTSETALAALRLAKFIPNERNQLVEFGVKAIEWLLDVLLDKEDHLVLDGIDKNADSPNGMKWTYNTGTTLSACCLIYEFTKNSKWQAIADDFAAAATNRHKSLFCRDYNEFDRRYWRDPSYFIQLLIEGLADYLMVFNETAPGSTKSAIKGEIARHLEFFRKYLYDPNDGLYFQMFEAHRISPEIWQVYCKQFGDTKKFDPNPEERGQEDNRDLKDKPLVKTLIGSGSAARIWFQSARVVPQL